MLMSFKFDLKYLLFYRNCKKRTNDQLNISLINANLIYYFPIQALIQLLKYALKYDVFQSALQNKICLNNIRSTFIEMDTRILIFGLFLITLANQDNFIVSLIYENLFKVSIY